MKFCDKLQKIRKENNITQEQLADKLNVSRQAVSKWESGSAYPDTEKLIQISKIFNVSLDELINDNKEGNIPKEKRKINFMEMFDIVFEFITKSINMFWSMKFMEKFKCLFEMMIVVLIIILGAFLSTSVVTELVRRIFMFIPGDFVYILCSLVDTLLYIVWLILGFIIVIKVFKTRYLDYYVVITDNKVEERTIEEPIRELKERKEYKVVIRDPEHSSFTLLKKIGQIFLVILKCFGFIIVIPVILTFIFCIMLLVVSLFYTFNGIFFNGISIGILGGIIFIYLVIEFIYNLIFNRSHAFSRIFIMFIGSITLIGIGLGLSFASISSFDYIENKGNTESHIIDWDDDLVLYDIYNISSDKIIVDDSIDYIKLDIITYGVGDTYIYGYDNIRYDDDTMEYNKFKTIDIIVDYDEIEIVKKIIDDLKDKKITSYNNYYDIDRVYISSDNLTKLRDNYIKYVY